MQKIIRLTTVELVLAGMIAVYTEKAEKELKNQEKVMLMQTTGHIWTKEEVQAPTDLLSLIHI